MTGSIPTLGKVAFGKYAEDWTERSRAIAEDGATL